MKVELNESLRLTVENGVSINIANDSYSCISTYGLFKTENSTHTLHV